MPRRVGLIVLLAGLAAVVWVAGRRDARSQADAAATPEPAPFSTAVDAPPLAKPSLAKPSLATVDGTTPAATRTPATTTEARGGVLRGRVVDEQERAVPGALVRGWCATFARYGSPPDRTTRSDDSGAFELHDLGPDFVADATADARACLAALRGRIAPGGVAEGELVIVLARAAAASGRVVGPSGEGVPARLHLSPEVDRQPTTTSGAVTSFVPVPWNGVADAAGSFVVPALPEGQEYSITATCAGYLSGRVRISVARSPVEIRMERGATVIGRVLGRGGEPVSGALVTAGGEGSESAETKTAEDGTYELSGVDPGTSGYVAAFAKGYAPAVYDGVEFSTAAPARADFTLDRGFALAGRVIDVNGAPLAGAHVKLEGDRTYERGYVLVGVPATLEHLAERGETRTGDDGRFRFDDLYLGTFVVRVYGPEGGDVHAEARVQTPVEDLLVRFDPVALGRVVLAGRVTDALTGEPIRSFKVCPMIASGSGMSGTDRNVDSPDGRFRVPGLDPGTISLSVRAQGYADWTSGAAELALGEHEHDVRLGPLRTVTLEVRQADGAPVAGEVGARFARASEAIVWVDNPWGGRTTRTRLSAGRGEVAGLPGDLLRVTFEVPELGEETFDLDLRAPPTEPVVFRLSTTIVPDFDVHLAVLEGTPGTNVEDVEHMTEEQARRLILVPETTAIEIRALDDEGKELLGAKIAPGESGWTTASWRHEHGTGSASKDRDVPELAATLPGRCRTLVIRAEGYVEQRLALRPAAENGGVPRLVLIRR